MYCTFYVLEINGNCDNCYSHKYKYGENFTVLKRNNKFLKFFGINMIIALQYLIIITINIYQNDQHLNMNPTI